MELMEERKITRHCAFCFIPLAEKDAKKCAKCHRRAYCGHECQTKDWKSKKASKPIGLDDFFDNNDKEGQGHKDWCGVPACEEDLDWVVKKGGKGVVAKRLILKGERILVGNGKQFQGRLPRIPTYHLCEPLSSGMLYRYTSRGLLFNHSCNANSIFNNAMNYEVGIFTATKDIEPGIEITMNYIGFSDDFIPNFHVLEDESTIPNNSFEDGRRELKSKYGIFCPKDCFCYNKEIEQLIIKGKKMTKDLFKMNGTFGEILNILIPPANSETVQILQNLVADFEIMGGNPVRKAQLICCLLNAMKKDVEYSHLIPNYEKKADEIYQSVFHPESPFSKLEGWMKYSFGS